MKKLILQFLILGLATAVFADDLPHFSITTNQAVEIKQKLDAYENGKLTLQDLNEKAGAEGNRELIGYAITHSHEVSVKEALPVSRAFALLGMYPQAAKIATAYVTDYSNDWRGWKVLGGANLLMSNLDLAVGAFTNAVNLGDESCLVPLCGTALSIDRDDIVTQKIPRLMIMKEAKETTSASKLDVVGVLMIYSIRADRQDIFVEALEGVSASDILSREDLKKFALQGCKQFKGKDIDKISQELESATSSTNSVSSPAH